MAGSYKHATADDGQLLNSQECVGMAAENGGDAFETIEEMYGMIWWLAHQIVNHEEAEATGPYTEDMAQRFAAGWVEDARKAYKDGLKASPGTNGTNPREDDDE